MTDRTAAPEAISRAFGAHLKSGVELLYAWKAGLPPDRAAKLADFEEKGVRIGISVNMPADRWIVQIFGLDAAGETMVLETIEQAGALNTSIN